MQQEATSFYEYKWDFVMDVIVKCTMLTCQVVGKHMHENKK